MNSEILAAAGVGGVAPTDEAWTAARLLCSGSNKAHEKLGEKRCFRCRELADALDRFAIVRVTRVVEVLNKRLTQ